MASDGSSWPRKPSVQTSADPARMQRPPAARPGTCAGGEVGSMRAVTPEMIANWLRGDEGGAGAGGGTLARPLKWGSWALKECQFWTTVALLSRHGGGKK